MSRLTLDQARDNINKPVDYHPFSLSGRRPTERGVITSVNTKYVFVRFGDAAGSKACRPNDLSLVH